MQEKLGWRTPSSWTRASNWRPLAFGVLEARGTLQKLMDDPDSVSVEAPYATTREIEVCGIKIWAFRISYVGEQGWELYFPSPMASSCGTPRRNWGNPVGIETYANSRRMEKSLRLQNADLEIDYNLYEAGLARPKVKANDFHGKEAYVAQRELPEQVAYLCTFVLEDTTDDTGVVRYPVGQWPLLMQIPDIIFDSHGRRSYTTSALRPLAGPEHSHGVPARGRPKRAMPWLWSISAVSSRLES